MPLLVIAGTSGSGKNTIIDRVVEAYPDVWVSTSMTTRDPRPGEVEGKDYYFVSDDEFDRVRDADGFLEWFEVYGHRSGTPRAPVEEQLATGRTVLLWLDVRGALAVKELIPPAVIIFVQAPSREEQRRRLEARGGDTTAYIERRLAEADWEEEQAHRFDRIVTNANLDEAVDEVAGILEDLRGRS